MAKTIQVRDVPDDIHVVLRSRAAAAGMSLSDYAREALVEVAARPTVAEVLQRAAARSGGASREDIMDVIHKMRGE